MCLYCALHIWRIIKYLSIYLMGQSDLGNYLHFVSYGARLFAENPFVEYDCTSKTTHCGTQANNADPDQGLHCLLTGCSNLKKRMSRSTKMFSTNSNGRKLILSVVKYYP